jgi:hypothetical protein
MDTTSGEPGNIDALFGADQTSAPSPVPAANPPPVLPPVPAPNGGDPALAQPQPSPAAPPVPVPTPAPAPEPQRVPLSELLEQRHRYQAERARADAVAQQNQQLMEVLRGMQRPPQPQQPPIDPVAEPERAFHALTTAVDQRLQAIEQARQADAAAMNQQLVNHQLNMSERSARAQHGGELVDAALSAALTAGIQTTFISQPDPYAALVQWHRANELAREIGTDPAAYRARIAQQERDRVIAEMRTGRQPSSVPPSIANATNGATAPQVAGSDRDFFNSMFARKPPA